MDIDETLVLARNTVRIRRSEVADAERTLASVRASMRLRPTMAAWRREEF